LHLRGIYKVVDSIFDTMTLISQDDDDLSHADFVNALMKQPQVREVVATRGRTKAVSFALSKLPSNSLTATRTDHDDDDTSTSDEHSYISGTSSSSESTDSDPCIIPQPLRMNQAKDHSDHHYGQDLSSEGDSVSLALQPITRISIHTDHNDSAEAQ